MNNKNICKDGEKLSEEFANFFLRETQNKPVFHIALSGGSTPKILFDLLAKEYATKFNWQTIHFWWGDERCVPPTDDESNYKMTKELLIDKIAIPPQNIHRILGENAPEKEAIRYTKEIEGIIPAKNGLPRFDLMLLGMGPDGHTASIFPNQIELIKAEPICAVATHPESGQKRVTLTGATINNSAEIAFLVTGANKAEKIQEIFNKEGDYKKYPAAHIKATDGKLSWYLDESAAGK
ncbi:6-phosphogluconolactonase [Marivirga lumbricoides]|uniref:6-phosphogluconolactonase n=1 Tax=Marivirga lumbricoides TaxID=1046115 RepID=A0A2T4DL52_9BACT|nr:6-phosphogluconolactonase [Marivirga lumbricoides]